MLSADPELALGVANWGAASKPSRKFAQLLVLLRSDVCKQVDVYGQPGVPLAWYRASGHGHITIAPGGSPSELDLAKTLVQERYFYRAAMHDGKLCFFK